MAVVVANRDNCDPTNEVEFIHRPYRCAEASLKGMVGVFDANGYVVQTNTAPTAGVEIAGIFMRRCGVSEAVSMFQQGFMAGYDVSGLAIGAPLYAGADGEVADAGTVVIGKVMPFSYSGEKMAYIDVLQTWAGA